MPQRGDRTLRRSNEGLISQVLLRLADDAERARARRRARAGGAGSIWQRGKLASKPAGRPRPRLLSQQVAREQYVAPTRAQRVVLSE
jgi:hypothetical protein